MIRKVSLRAVRPCPAAVKKLTPLEMVKAIRKLTKMSHYLHHLVWIPTAAVNSVHL
jgi:hypothetical protein